VLLLTEAYVGRVVIQINENELTTTLYLAPQTHYPELGSIVELAGQQASTNYEPI